MSLSGTARPNQARILLFSSLRHSHVLSCTLHPTAFASCEYLSNNSNGYIRKPVKRSLGYRRVPAGDFPAATRKLRDLDHAGSFLSEFWERRCPSVLRGAQSHRGAKATCSSIYWSDRNIHMQTTCGERSRMDSNSFEIRWYESSFLGLVVVSPVLYSSFHNICIVRVLVKPPFISHRRCTQAESIFRY